MSFNDVDEFLQLFFTLSWLVCKVNGKSWIIFLIVHILIFDLIEIEFLNIKQRWWIVDFVADEDHEVADLFLDFPVWEVSQIDYFLNAVFVQNVLLGDYFEHFL